MTRDAVTAARRALILAPFAAESLTRLRGSFEVVYEPWTATRRLWDPAELAERLTRERIEALVVEIDFLFEELFQEGSPLRFAGVCRSTLNQVDLEAAARRGVVVVNTPGRNAPAVAELTIGLLLALARGILPARDYIMSGRWEEPLGAYDTLRGVELGGKTLGVVGLGAIGGRVARMGRALGMRVVGSDPYVTPPRSVRAATLELLLQESDAVSLHLPLTAETRGLLDARRLALMKPEAFLVNTAAYELIDERALVAVLKGRRIAGAALDVFETHPLVPSSPLLALDNVLLTPHIGGATPETIERHSRAMTDDLLRWARGRRPWRQPTPGASGERR